MGIFDRSQAKPDPTLDELAAQARGGDPQGALVAATAKLEGVAKRAGKESPAYAAQLFEYASLLLFLGMTERAVGSMRAASEIRGPRPEDEKARLTYLMNLGDTLAYAGHLDEAMTVHQAGLEERARFYGKEHPGYAFGLDSRAETAIALGRFAEALEDAKQSLAIYDAHKHPRVPHAWSLLFLAAAGTKGGWSSLQIAPDMADAVLDALIGRTLPVQASVLRGAVEVLASRAGDKERVIRAWAAVESRARREDDHASWALALERIGELAEARGDGALVVDARLGLALCKDRAGDAQGAMRAYDDALERARKLGSPEALVKALRNGGLQLVSSDREGGLSRLRAAVAVEGAPADEHSRACVALGIQLQHAGELAEAREHLAAACAAMDPAHPDAMCARSHLRALDEHASCGCGQPLAEVHAQVERIVRERLPEGLLDRIEFQEGNVGIHVTRVLSDSEARLVADTVDLAMAEMRKRIGAVYGSN